MKTIFIVLDTVRRDFLTAYGNDWVHTPAISRLTQRGVTFDNHWVGSLPCMPARREFMTGRHNFMYRGWGPIEPYDDTLPVTLREAGVFSHLLTDHQHYFELGGENYHTAFDTWEFFRGQENDPWVSLVDAPALPPHFQMRRARQNWQNRSRYHKEEEFPSPRTIQSAIEWLEANRGADNFMLQVELFDPHEPFHCTDEYRALYNDLWDEPIFDWPSYEKVKESPQVVEHIRKCYAALLTMTDHWLGKLFDQLDALNLWDDTLVILTTDHGIMLGEHQYWMKNYMPVYNEIARIPLIMAWPGVESGTRCNALTQTIDVMPTILDWHHAPLPPHIQGKSLHGILTGKETKQDVIFGYFGMATNITDGRYVYFRNPVNADGGPLHAYTAMPTGGLNTWYSRDVYSKMEMGRYFGHTYNLPLYKIPTSGGVPDGAASGGSEYVAHHELWDLETDPQQNSPLQDTAREEHFCARIAAHLKSHDAPPEQFARLGIDPLLSTQ